MSEQTITEMDKAAAKALGEATLEALQGVAERFGVAVQSGGGQYDPLAGTYKPKIVFSEQGGAEREFRQSAMIYDLEPDDWNAEFVAQGRRFRIVGINFRARTMPINCEEIGTGRTFKFAAEGVKRALQRERSLSHDE